MEETCIIEDFFIKKLTFMYAKKPPKSQLPDKNNVTHYYPHDTDINERPKIWTRNYYIVISIDPGIKWFGLRIEGRPVHSFPSSNYFHPYTIAYEQVCFKDYDTDSESGLCMLYMKISDYLDTFENHFDKINFVIIERQMTVNYKMVRLSQHIITYFHLKLKNRPLLPSILEIDPKLKTNGLGSQKGLTKPEVKKWAVEKAYELLAMRSDDHAISIINGAKKKDEFGDTVCQIEACFSYYKLPLTNENVLLQIEIDDSANGEKEDPDDPIVLPGYNSDIVNLNGKSLKDIISSVSNKR